MLRDYLLSTQSVLQSTYDACKPLAELNTHLRYPILSALANAALLDTDVSRLCVDVCFYFAFLSGAVQSQFAPHLRNEAALTIVRLVR